MLNEKYQHYVCIVAGEQPDELMKPYDINKKVEPYTLYEYKNAKKIKNIWLDTVEFYEKDKQDTWYAMPEGVSAVPMNPVTGKYDKKSKTLFYFLNGTEIPYLN